MQWSKPCVYPCERDMEPNFSSSRVAGIDVGGRKKGFHAVALENGAYLDQKGTRDVHELVKWCVRIVRARVIAVDAPCRWSRDGHARPAERALMQQGIFCFSSTTREKAVSHPTDYFGWMLRGEELYQALERTHPLGDGPSGPYCFETFPHAITWQLRGGSANAKRKRAERSELLHRLGIYFKDRVGIDTMDAALCAYMAHLVATGRPKLSLGETPTGYIVIPALGKTMVGSTGFEPVTSTVSV